MIKRYVAYVALEYVEYFKEKLREREDKIHLVNWGCVETSSEGTLYRPCVIEAEEGVINPKFELPFEQRET